MRRVTPADAQACGDICYRVRGHRRAHNFPPDFPSAEVAVGLLTALLSRPDVIPSSPSLAAASSAAISCGSPRGSPASARSPSTLTGRTARVGRALMLDVMARARTGRVCGHSAGAVGVPQPIAVALHQARLRCPRAARRFQGTAIGATLAGFPVRPATPADLDGCDALCRAVHGHDRSAEVREAIAGARDARRAHGRITGYATVDRFLGHAVARDQRRPQGADWRGAGVSRSRLPAADAQRRRVPVVPRPWPARRAADDADEHRALQRAARRVHAIDPLLSGQTRPT